MTAAQLAQNVQAGSKTAAESFNRFVEGDAAGGSGNAAIGQGGAVRTGGRGGLEPEKRDFWDSFGAAPAGPPVEKRDFWDDFSAAGEERMSALHTRDETSSVGTTAMRNTGSTTAKGKGPATAGSDSKEDEWKDW